MAEPVEESPNESKSRIRRREYKSHLTQLSKHVEWFNKYGYSCCAVVSHISQNGALCVGSAIFGDNDCLCDDDVCGGVWWFKQFELWFRSIGFVRHKTEDRTASLTLGSRNII
ncbi:hypothetical protein BaRGS_00013983 [Batillaria attramentaria]|uniref:Uncharacterized protein n=1 Tax=Batillaria attramentaria TaxID=370345 RepID=A0ABD0L6I1_9CAEN